MRLVYPQCTHITRRRGIYHYRRRLPNRSRGEVLLSLRTRCFREAEHLAEVLGRAFPWILRRVLSQADQTGKLGPILRAELQRVLEGDLRRRVERPAGSAVYDHGWETGDAISALEADLSVIRATKTDFDRHIAENWWDDLTDIHADDLLRQHGLPATLKPALAHGLLEVARRFWEVAELRSLGKIPVVMPADAPVREPGLVPVATPDPSDSILDPKPDPTTAATDTGVLASDLVEPFFERRENTDRTTHQVMGQERGTLRRFIEAAGDRPLRTYTRADVSKFLDILRRLPKTYGKSPRDKERSLADLIAEADAKQGDRLTDKTVKRHLSTLSQFFQMAVDRGHLTVAARTELVDGHRFRESRGARDQRDAWTSEEIAKLFTSPVWSGCYSPSRRAEAGRLIIRDARFWLPLLALFHGARLEEFADLYRRDIDCENGTWFIRLVETKSDDGDPTVKERRLKTSNAARVVPIHPEIVRLGFLDYIARTAPEPAAPLFPDLQPQGKDGKRGPRITRWFVEYRRTVGVYRRGVAMHAFRHTANTRLRDVVTDYGRERHVNYLLGHSQGGGQGRERYDKGPGLKALAETLSLLAYPELDLRHLHVPAAAA
jgi:integrase